MALDWIVQRASPVPKLGTGGSGTFNVTLANAIAKLADTQANGGAGISFSAHRSWRATVTINAEDEISFSISDAAGRTVMSGKAEQLSRFGSNCRQHACHMVHHPSRRDHQSFWIWHTAGY